MEGSRLVDFAPPVGRQYVYYVPHTEVTTLPRHFPTLRHCAVRGSWRPELMQDMRVLQRYGLLAGPALDADQAGDLAALRRRARRVAVDAVRQRRGRRHARRRARSGGPTRSATRRDWGQRGVARMTGVAAAVGVQLLARHGRAAAGFVDPEEYFDPLEFLAELERRESIVVECQEAVAR